MFIMIIWLWIVVQLTLTNTLVSHIIGKLISEFVLTSKNHACDPDV